MQGRAFWKVRHQLPNNRLFSSKFPYNPVIYYHIQRYLSFGNLKIISRIQSDHTLQIDHHERWIFLNTGLRGKWICARTHIPWDIWANRLKMLFCPDLTRLAVWQRIISFNVLPGRWWLFENPSELQFISMAVTWIETTRLSGSPRTSRY